MSADLRVAKPPPRPLMIFDGDCGFCRRWIVRWQRWTLSRVDYTPAQDEHIAEQFPELNRERLATAVHLIAPDGAVCFGAEAVIRSLSFAGHARWLLRWYEYSGFFARLAEWSYRFVARHRKLFSTLA